MNAALNPNRPSNWGLFSEELCGLTQQGAVLEEVLGSCPCFQLRRRNNQQQRARYLGSYPNSAAEVRQELAAPQAPRDQEARRLLLPDIGHPPHTSGLTHQLPPMEHFPLRLHEMHFSGFVTQTGTQPKQDAAVEQTPRTRHKLEFSAFVTHIDNSHEHRRAKQIAALAREATFLQSVTHTDNSNESPPKEQISLRWGEVKFSASVTHTSNNLNQQAPVEQIPAAPREVELSDSVTHVDLHERRPFEQLAAPAHEAPFLEFVTHRDEELRELRPAQPISLRPHEVEFSTFVTHADEDPYEPRPTEGKRLPAHEVKFSTFVTHMADELDQLPQAEQFPAPAHQSPFSAFVTHRCRTDGWVLTHRPAVVEKADRVAVDMQGPVGAFDDRRRLQHRTLSRGRNHPASSGFSHFATSSHQQNKQRTTHHVHRQHLHL